jgi:hypothetical protein
MDSKVNDKLHKWIHKKCGDSKFGKVQATRGKLHNYLGVKLDYSTPKNLRLNMEEKIIEEFIETWEESKYPWHENLFKIDETAEKLSITKVESFHKIVTKIYLLVNKQDLRFF